MTKHTVESLMALADAYAEASHFATSRTGTGKHRAALSAALAPQVMQSIECKCGRTHKKTPYGWASNEVAQPVCEPLPGACEV